MSKESGENLAFTSDVKSSLRDRIADVLAKDDGINLGSCWDYGDLLNIADVIIRELGMRQLIMDTSDGPMRLHCYATQWERIA